MRTGVFDGAGGAIFLWLSLAVAWVEEEEVDAPDDLVALLLEEDDADAAGLDVDSFLEKKEKRFFCFGGALFTMVEDNDTSP